MDPRRSTCALLGDNLVGRESPCCELCPDTPHCDISGFRSSFHYCSLEHLDLDKTADKKICKERQAHRAFVRIGAVCNASFLCVEEALFPCQWRITSYREEFLSYYATIEPPNTHISERRPWYPDGMPEEVLRAALSYENCIASVTLLTLFVAWCLQGDY
jgi:hypothetical protein